MFEDRRIIMLLLWEDLGTEKILVNIIEIYVQIFSLKYLISNKT